MNKHLLFSLLVPSALVPYMAHAGSLSPGEALARLANERNLVAAIGTHRVPEFELVHEELSDGLPTWYAFNIPEGGFAIVGADDVARPLIGYSCSGSFDLLEVAPAMRWWLDGMSHEIAMAAAKSHAVPRTVATRPDRNPIQPMIATRWDQGSPYNILCPQKNGKPTHTGCVATAMAQVMKYFNYPPRGTGETTYVWNGQTLSADFGNTQFRWDGMVDSYTPDASDEQRQAVAELMKACGYSVKMDYGTSESSASVYDWAPAMITHFGYAPSTTPLNRSFYGLYDWEDAIYASLAQGSPVLYAGQGSAGGHAFICDGYDTDGYFHFNWGWSGKSDGYYSLSALNPPHLGTGGGAGGFNAQQMAVVNIRPRFEGSSATPILGVSGDYSLTFSNVSGNLSFSGSLINYSNSPISFKIGFEIEDSEGATTYAGAEKAWNTLEVLGYMQSFSRAPSQKLSDGTYTVRPAFAVAGSGDEELVWHRVSLPAGRPQSFILTISGGKGSVSQPEYGMNLSATDLKIVRPPHNNFPIEIAATLNNVSGEEAVEDLTLLVIDKSNNIVANSAVYPVNLPAGATEDLEATVTCSKGAGEYDLLLVARYNSSTKTDIPLAEPLRFSLLPGATAITLTPEYFHVNAWMEDGTAIVKVSTGVRCTEGFYARPIYFWIGSDGSWPYPFNSDNVYLETGETTEIAVEYPFAEGKDGDTYTLLANFKNANGNNTFYEKKEFTIGVSSADAVVADEDGFSIYTSGSTATVRSAEGIRRLDLHSVHGVLQSSVSTGGDTSATADLSPLQPGVYLIRATGTKGTVRTFRLIRH